MAAAYRQGSSRIELAAPASPPRLHALHNLAFIAAEQARLEAAAGYFAEPLSHAEILDPRVALDSISVAAVSAQSDDYVDAARLLAACDRLEAVSEHQREPVEECLRTRARECVRNHIDDPHVRAAAEEGRAMTLPDAAEAAFSIVILVRGDRPDTVPCLTAAE